MTNGPVLSVRAGRGRYPYNRGRHLILPTVLYAYGDESGLHAEASHCLVLGYIGAPDQWETFVPRWEAALISEGVSAGFFHARDFFQGRGEYRSWCFEKRDRLLYALVDAISEQEVYPLGVAVDIQAYEDLTEAQQHYFTGDGIQAGMVLEESHLSLDGYVPKVVKKMTNLRTSSQVYHVAAISFLMQAIRMAPDDCEVHAILASHEQLSGAIRNFFEERLLHNNPYSSNKIFAEVSYRDARRTPSLQVADLYAYLWGRFIEGHSLGQRETFALRALTDDGKWRITKIDAPFFEDKWSEVMKDVNQRIIQQGLDPGRGDPEL